jgi:hypothetical protein
MLTVRVACSLPLAVTLSCSVPRASASVTKRGAACWALRPSHHQAVPAPMSSSAASTQGSGRRHQGRTASSPSRF